MESENHSPTRSKIRRAKSGAHTATDFGLGKPLTHKRRRGGNPGGKISAAEIGVGKQPLTHGGQKIGGQNLGYGFWTRTTTHPQGAKSGGENLGAHTATDYVDSENHSPTGSNIRGAKSLLRILDSENHSPTGGQNPREAKFPATDCGLGKPLTHGGGRGAKSRGQNPGYGFWTRKTTHPWVAKSQLRIWNWENQSPTLKIIEDPQTQALFPENNVAKKFKK